MAQDIQVFSNIQFGEIRTVLADDGEPRFCLTDVCRVLGLKASDVARRLHDDMVSNHPISDSLGRTQQANFVNEDGLYDAIFDSRKKEARAFRKWVTSEVLPSIRKTGGYIATKADDTPEEIMARALMVAQSTLENQKKFNAVKETLAMDSKVEGIKNGKLECVSFGSDFVGEMADAVVATAIARSTKVGEPTIVKGNTGVCLFVVDNINNNEAVVNADVVAKRKEITEARKVDIRTNLENYLLDGVKVVDKRGISEL